MWPQNYTPVSDSLGWSALVAAFPIFVLLVLIGIIRKPAWMASLAGLAAAALVAAGVYRMPLGRLAAAITYGAAFGLFPIGWVVFSAILLYRITLETGKFDMLKDSIGRLTGDRRLQALLIAFAFGAFIEGAAGFGTPVAVASAMLVGLGFEPFYAAAICLLANTAPVAFGSIAIPITTLAVTTGLPVERLSAGVGRICAPVSLFVPAYLILVMSGWKGLRGVLPAAAVCGLAFAGTQFAISNFVSAQLTDILASLAAMGALFIVIRFTGSRSAQAKRSGGEIAGMCGRALGGAAFAVVLAGCIYFAVLSCSNFVRSLPAGDLRSDLFKLLLALVSLVLPFAILAAGKRVARPLEMAWAPYVLLVIFVLLWGYAPIKARLDSLNVLIPWPGLHNTIQRVPPVVAKAAPYVAVYSFPWLSASGTACLFAAIMGAMVAGLKLRQFVGLLKHTAKQLALAELTLAAVLGLAFLMNYSGATATLGLAFAATGALFPFFSALLGWLGVFLTGSDTSANALFGTLQVVTAGKLGMNQVLMASANSAGGVMGKMISLTSIAVAAAATSMKREDEGLLFRFTMKHSVLLASIIGLIVMFYAYVMPAWAP